MKSSHDKELYKTVINDLSLALSAYIQGEEGTRKAGPWTLKGNNNNISLSLDWHGSNYGIINFDYKVLDDKIVMLNTNSLTFSSDLKYQFFLEDTLKITSTGLAKKIEVFFLSSRPDSYNQVVIYNGTKEMRSVNKTDISF